MEEATIKPTILEVLLVLTDSHMLVDSDEHPCTLQLTSLARTEKLMKCERFPLTILGTEHRWHLPDTNIVFRPLSSQLSALSSQLSALPLSLSLFSLAFVPRDVATPGLLSTRPLSLFAPSASSPRRASASSSPRCPLRRNSPGRSGPRCTPSTSRGWA